MEEPGGPRLLNLGGGSERLLVNLDAHPDRTLGARAMDCTVIAQEKTAHIFRSRPATFKAQGDETGSEWENIPGLGNIRWVAPEITFSHQMSIHWGDDSVVLEHHAGPTPGAAWVIVPEGKSGFRGGRGFEEPTAIPGGCGSAGMAGSAQIAALLELPQLDRG